MDFYLNLLYLLLKTVMPKMHFVNYELYRGFLECVRQTLCYKMTNTLSRPVMCECKKFQLVCKFDHSNPDKNLTSIIIYFTVDFSVDFLLYIVFPTLSHYIKSETQYKKQRGAN